MGLCSKYLQVVVNGVDLSTSKPVRNIFYLVAQNFFSGDTKTQVQVADDFKTFWTGSFLPLLSEEYNCIGIGVRNFDDTADAGENNSGASPGLGGITGDALPADNAIVVNWLTGKRGKSFRGKTHFGLVAESATDGDVLEAVGTTIADWKSAAGAYVGFSVAGVSTATVWTPHIFRPTPTGPIPTSGTFTPIVQPITAYALNKMIGSMNRRKPKGVYA